MRRLGKKWVEEPTIEEIRRKNKTRLKIKNRQQRLVEEHKIDDQKPSISDNFQSVSNKINNTIKKVDIISIKTNVKNKFNILKNKYQATFKKKPKEPRTSEEKNIRPKSSMVTILFAGIIWFVIACLFIVGID